MGPPHVRRLKAVLLLRSVGSAALLFAARATAVIYQLRFANHEFGVGYGGLIALLNQITFYILLAELGLAAATTSLLFAPAHRGDTGVVKALIEALQVDVRRILYTLGPLSMLGAVGLAFSLRHQLSLLPLTVSLLLTCVSALLTFLALPYQSHFNATDRVPTRNVILGSGFALKVVLGIGLAKAMHSFVGLPLGTMLVGIAELLVQRALVVSQLGEADTTPEMVAEARSSIRNRAKYVVAHRVGYLFIYQSDYIILLLSSSLSLLGYYAQYQYLYAGILSFAIAVGGTLTARIAKRQIDLGREGFARFYGKTSSVAAVGAVLCGTGLYLFGGLALRVLYKSNTSDLRVLLLFSILLMLNVLKMNDDLWIDSTGAFEKGFYLPILEACTYVVLGLFFVRHLQMAGILYAGIATNLLFSVGCKAVVIGRGVMDRQFLSTAAVKVASVVGVSLTFYLLIRGARLLPFLHAI
jgi:O-antigen/teichoic acid export membrane protein